MRDRCSTRTSGADGLDRPVGSAIRFDSLAAASGQSTVEFALVLPLFAALVLVFLGFGRVVYYYLGTTHLAEEGARLAAVSANFMPDGSSSETLGQYMCGKLKNGGNTSATATQVTVAYPNNEAPSAAQAGDPVTVGISLSYKVIPLPYFNITVPVSSSATMRVETAPSVTGSTLMVGKSPC